MKHTTFLVAHPHTGHYLRFDIGGFPEWTDNIGLAWIWRTPVVHAIASFVNGTVIGGAR